MITATVELDDGRSLAVREAGAPSGRPVVVHHGTPDAGVLFEPWAIDAARRGIRLIGYDRPGYGGSTPHPGRRIADAAADVHALLDHLDVDRYATWGISGGGPHALACAALGGGRCVGAAALASVAPFDAEGLNFFAGMGRDNLIEFGAALQGREALEPIAQLQADAMLAATPAQLIELLRSLVEGPDEIALERGFGEFWALGMVDAFAQGIGGWVDDDLAFLEPWGFDPGAVEVPVLVRHGRQDRFVPVSHGEWLARAIPGADVRITVDDAHLTLVTTGIGEIHGWLLDRS